MHIINDVTHLSNGIRVLTVPHQDTAAVTLFVLFGVGSRHESARVNGASHYIEHMMFKGTRKRPTTLEISKDLDSVGASYNAFTAKDHTGYYIKLPYDELPLAIDILEDMLYHSTFDKHNLDAERNVIIEEIRMYEDNPMMLVDELMEEELYVGSSLARPIAGTERTMRHLEKKTLLAFKEKHYLPSNTVIAVAGRMDHGDVLKRLERAFGKKRTKTYSRRIPTRFVRRRFSGSKPRFRIHRKDTEQVQVSLGFLAYPRGDRRLSALSVLSTILGGTMSSRLFTSVRERLGLCYYIRSSVVTYQDSGGIDIQAGLSREGTERGLRAIAREIRRVRDNKVGTEELTRAKSYLRGKFLLSLENSSMLAEWYAKQELLTGKVETIEQQSERIAKVTKDDIQRVAKDVFRSYRCAVAIIGPSDDEDLYRKAISAI